MKRLGYLSAVLLAALGLVSCSVSPYDETPVTTFKSSKPRKDLATCIHPVLEKMFGTELRYEDLSFAEEYRFSWVIPMTLIMGIGRGGDHVPFILTIKGDGPGSTANLKAHEPYVSRVGKEIQVCI